MGRYYAFLGTGTSFCRATSLRQAMSLSKGKEDRVFKHVDGIPNPWWVYAVVDGKVDKTKIHFLSGGKIKRTMRVRLETKAKKRK